MDEDVKLALCASMFVVVVGAAGVGLVYVAKHQEKPDASICARPGQSVQEINIADQQCVMYCHKDVDMTK